MKTGSLRFRLFLATALSVSIALLLAFWGLGQLFSSHVERRAIVELSVQLDQILAGIGRNDEGRIVITSAPADPRFSLPYGGLYWQIESEGRPLRSRSLWDFALDLPQDQLNDGAVHALHLPGPGDSQLLVLERSVQLPARLGGGVVRAAVAMDTVELTESTGQFRQDLLPYTLLLALFLVLAGLAQVVFGLRPLNAVERRVAKIRTGEENRLGEGFPSEIRPLAGEVDALLIQREQDIAQAKHRAGDLAHGLKTPLQALLGEAGRVRDAGLTDTAASIEGIADSMHRRVERELNKVRIASRAATSRTDISDAVNRVVAVVQKATAQEPVGWEVEIAGDLMVAAEMEDLLEILGAITENAARHARRKVRVSAQTQGRQVVLNVEDDGPGIASEKMQALLRRGAREDEGGTGLGLAIAQELAETLGGSLELVARDPGLLVRVTLPAAPV